MTRTPDETEVIDALKYIDAWGIDYDQWVSILMAIHSAFPGENGLRIAEQWGNGRPGEVSQKWKSFKVEGNATGCVSIGTLFAVARECGWKRDLQRLSALAARAQM